MYSMRRERYDYILLTKQWKERFIEGELLNTKSGTLLLVSLNCKEKNPEVHRMQFYKFEGITAAEKWSEENDSRRIMREKVRKISMKTNAFNQLQQYRAYLFVSDASESTVTVGVIVKNCSNIIDLISEYLRAIEIELKEICFDEITFNSLRNMLSCASRNDYIRDDDEVLEQFDLDKLTGRYSRGITYGEKILDACDKKSVYEDAERFLTEDTFIPELNRIYAGSAKQNPASHPVHYMIQTDDRETRKGMCRILLQALYANNRLHSKRYCFLDFRPGESFSSMIYDCLYKSAVGGAVVVRYLSEKIQRGTRKRAVY